MAKTFVSINTFRRSLVTSIRSSWINKTRLGLQQNISRSALLFNRVAAIVRAWIRAIGRQRTQISRSARFRAGIGRFFWPVKQWWGPPETIEGGQWPGGGWGSSSLYIPLRTRNFCVKSLFHVEKKFWKRYKGSPALVYRAPNNKTPE